MTKNRNAVVKSSSSNGGIRKRITNANDDHTSDPSDVELDKAKQERFEKKSQFRKIVLLIIAVTVHNIPEGLAVGVGFGA